MGDTAETLAHTCPAQTPTIFVFVFFPVVTLGDLKMAPVPHEPSGLLSPRSRNQVSKALDLLGPSLTVPFRFLDNPCAGGIPGGTRSPGREGQVLPLGHPVWEALYEFLYGLCSEDATQWEGAVTF